MEGKSPKVTTSVNISPHLKKKVDNRVKAKEFSTFTEFVTMAVTEKLSRIEMAEELGISVPECCPPSGGKAKKPAPGRSDSARQQPKTENPENDGD